MLGSEKKEEIFEVKMRYFLLMALVMSMFAITKPVVAQEADPPAAPTLVKIAPEKGVFGSSCAIDVWSKYVGGTGGAVLNHDPAIQPTCTIFHNPTGLYAGLWASLSPIDLYDGTVRDRPGNEVDWYLGWSRDFGDGWYARGQLAYWDTQRLFSGSAEHDTGQALLKLKKKFNAGPVTISPYAQVAWVVAFKDTRPEIDENLGVELEILLFEKWSVSGFGEGIHDAGSAGVQSGFMWQASAQLNWKVSDRVTIRPIEFRAIGPITGFQSRAEPRGREPQTTFGSGFEVNF